MFFAKSSPIVVIFIVVASFREGDSLAISTLAHRCRFGKGATILPLDLDYGSPVGCASGYKLLLR